MTEEIEGLYIGADGTVKFVKVRDELDEYYKLLDCRMIEMPMRTVGGLAYNIICDEEGSPAMKEGAVPTVFGLDGKPMIYGSVFFCLVNDEGNVQSLTKAHMVNLADYLYCGLGPEGARFVMTGADY